MPPTIVFPRHPWCGEPWGSHRIVRCARAEDADMVAPFAEATGDLKFTAWSVVEDIRHARPRAEPAWVIEEAGVVRGFATSNDRDHLGLVVVDPAMKQRGLGRALFAVLIDRCFGLADVQGVSTQVRSDDGAILVPKLGFDGGYLTRNRWTTWSGPRWHGWFR